MKTEEGQKLNFAIMALEESIEILNRSDIDKNSVEFHLVSYNLYRVLKVAKELLANRVI